MIDTLEIIKEVDDLLYRKAEIPTAIEVLEDHLEKIKEGSILLSVDIPLVTKRLAYCYRDIGEIEDSYRLLEEALEASLNDLNRTEESDILAAISELDLRKGDIEGATKNAKKSFDYIGHKRGIKFAEAKVNTINALANTYNYTDTDRKDVLKFHNKAKRVSIEAGNNFLLLSTLVYIFNYHLGLEQVTISTEKLLEENVSIDLVKETNIILLPQYLIIEGRLRVKNQTYSIAEEFFIEALEFAQEKGLRNDIALANYTLGSFYLEKDPQKSLSYLTKALDEYRNIGWGLGLEELESQINSLN